MDRDAPRLRDLISEMEAFIEARKALWKEVRHAESIVSSASRTYTFLNRRQMQVVVRAMEVSVAGRSAIKAIGERIRVLRRESRRLRKKAGANRRLS